MKRNEIAEIKENILRLKVTSELRVILDRSNPDQGK